MNVFDLHEKPWNSLQGRRGRLPHALLIDGQKGLGKFELAEHFAASLLCESPQAAEKGRACGTCLACRWLGQGNHPDFRLLQPEALTDAVDTEEGKKKGSQQITIDQVRALDDFLMVGTHRGGLRIIVVNPAEAMNRSTANSLLKTLEEPTPNTLFILVSSEPARLLPTIRSRCQRVPVPIPAPERAARVLTEAGVANAEQWLALAGGAPGLALALSRDGQGAWLEAVIRQLAPGARVDPLAAAVELDKLIKGEKGRLSLRQVVEILQKWLVDLNLVKNGQAVRYFLSQQATIAALADKIPAARLIRAYREAGTRRQEAEQPLNARLFLEGLFLEYRTLFAQ